MKRITFTLFALCLCVHSYAQDPTFNISSQSQWNPDSVPQYNDVWGYVDCYENEYAIIGSRYDIHFVDVTDPTTPAEVASFSGGEPTVWRDIKTYRGRAYAVSDNTSEGLMIFNLAGLPFEVDKTYQSNVDFNSAQNIFIDETFGRLYVAGSDTADLLIFDISTNPDSPTLLTATSLPGGYLRDIHVKNQVAYCSHLANGLYIYDCSNPQSILTIGSIANYPGEVMNNSSWLSPDGSKLLFCDEVPGAKVKLMDVSDPSNLSVAPEHLFGSTLLSTDSNSIAHKPYFRDNYAFVSYYHDGVQVFDISDPEDIQKVAYLDTYTDNTDYDGLIGNWGLYPYLPSGNILASDTENGLFVLSMDLIELDPISNPNAIDTELLMSGAPIICEGDSVSLFAAEGDYTYLWTHDGQVLDVESSEIMAKESGVYQVEISNGACQVMSEAYEVTFLERPDLSSLAGATAEICYGENFPIMAPAGFSYYIWMKNGNALPNTNNFLMVVQSGVYNLLAYNENGCSSLSEAYDINVIEVPSPNLMADESVICDNQETILEAAEGADNYAWYYNGQIIEETTDPFYIVNQAGNYEVELQIGNCTKLSSTIEIGVIQGPNNTIGINGPAEFCAGETTILNAAQQPEITAWSWSLNAVVIGTEPNVEVSESGVYELIVTSTNSCTASNTIEITVWEAAVPEIVVNDNELSSTEANSYQWYYNGTLVPGATDQNLEASQNGYYQVEITDMNGCTATSDAVEFQMTDVHNPESLQGLELFPNPTDDFLNINFDDFSGQSLRLQLLDTKGSLVFEKNIEAGLNVSEQINMTRYASGLYILKVISEDRSLSRKVVKE